MASRQRSPFRLTEIVEAAMKVFLTTGYRQARMTEIARAAGVSPGLLYRYAESKEALFHLVLERELGIPIDRMVLPAPAPEKGASEALVRQALGEVASLPALDRAMRRRVPTDPRPEIEEVVGQHYDGVHRYRRVIALAERSALERPELAERFYVGGRRPFVERLARYIERGVRAGYFRPVPDAEVAARFVIEAVAWFANHRYGDYDGAAIDDEAARRTVLHMVSAALIPA